MIFANTDRIHTHGIHNLEIVIIDKPLPSGNIYTTQEVEKALVHLEGSPVPALIGYPAYEFIEQVASMESGDKAADPFSVRAQGTMENLRIQNGYLVGDLYPLVDHVAELERIVKTPFDVSLFTITEDDDFENGNKILKNITFVCVRILPAPH